jgi:nucleotide-binding universal stress UspA family protein
MEEKLIVVAIENYSRAQVLQTFLESNGIECFLRNVNLVQPTVSEGVKVQIRESDAAKALKLLSEKHHKGLEKSVPGIRKILVPIDFSAPSQNAARFALLLASKYGSEIKLLHVFNSPMVDMIPFTDAASIQIDVDISYQVLHRNAKENLLKFFNDLKEFASQIGLGHINIGYALREGYASYGITEMAKHYRPGIIVMGTKGEGFRSTELVGSVATEVSEETHLPLLVIPEKSVLKGIDEVKNVLYTTNFDESDFVAIRKLLSIVSAFNVSLHCIHVSDQPESPAIKAKMGSIKEYFDEVSPKVPVECSVIKGKDVVRAYKEYIAEKKISLVALTYEKRNMIYRMFNPSVTKKMLYESDVPVLIFRA